MTSHLFTAGLLVALAALPGCANHKSPDPLECMIDLRSSGFGDFGDPAFVILCESTSPEPLASDTLRSEILRVWRQFEPEATDSGLSQGTVFVSGPSPPALTIKPGSFPRSILGTWFLGCEFERRAQEWALVGDCP